MRSAHVGDSQLRATYKIIRLHNSQDIPLSCLMGWDEVFAWPVPTEGVRGCVTCGRASGSRASRLCYICTSNAGITTPSATVPTRLPSCSPQKRLGRLGKRGLEGREGGGERERERRRFYLAAICGERLACGIDGLPRMDIARILNQNDMSECLNRLFSSAD